MASKNSVIINIDGDDSGFQTTLSGIGKATGKSIAGITKMSAAVYAAGKAIGTMGVKYNAEIEQLQTSFEVMTGSAEKAASVVNRLRTMGAETPFETADLAKITQLLMQYGFTADDALQKMSMLGDISQGNAEAMQSIATGYAQMSSAGKVNLQDVKQMINGGFNPLQEISERTGESMASLYDRISKGKMTIDEITQSMVAATSEGGKFYQSMDKQSQTLNGQLSTLKDNASQLLGTLTTGMSDGLRTEILPLANNIVGELQESFESGGVDGLIDSATNMIPDLLKMMTGELEDAISGVSRWLPQGATKIMEAFPSALKSASAVTPQITNALFETASTVITSLVSMLPELIPTLVEGFVNTFSEALNGIDKLVTGVFTGIEQALHKGKTKIAGVWVDDEQIAKYDFDIDVGVDENSIDQKISQAKAAVEKVLEGIEGVDASKIAESIISGDVTDALNAALVAAGVDPKTANQVAESIKTAQKTVSDAISELNVGEEASAKIREMAENGASEGELADYIKSFGIDETVASETAAKIAGASTTVSNSINKLPESIRTAIADVALSGDRDTLVASLQILGLDTSEIESVLASYDATSSLISAGITGIFTNIKDTLTDGLPDTEEVIGGLEADVRAWAQEAYTKIDEWYNSEVEALKASGKTGAEYDAALLDVEQKAQGMRDSVQEAEAGAIDFMTSMSGKSTEYVQQHLDELEAISQQAQAVSAEIDVLTAKAASQGAQAYSVVRSGVNADEQTIALAIKYKVTEFKLEEQSAEDAYNAAIEQLNNDLSSGKIGKEEYNQGVETATETRDAAKQAAKDAFDKAFSEIMQGIAESEGNTEALNRAMELSDTKISLSEFAENMFDDSGDLNVPALDSLKEKLKLALGDAFNEDTFDANANSMSALDFQNYINSLAVQVDEIQTDALSDALGGKVGEAWAAAMESGELTGTGFDVSGTEDQIRALYEAVNLEPVGDDLSAGVGEGMAAHDFGTEAARTEQNIENSLRAAADSHSPAQAFVPIGSDISAGVGEGMSEFDFSSSTGTMVNGIKLVISNAAKDAKSAGESIPSGAAIGIATKAYVAVNAAAAMARAVVAKIRSVFNSHSPSKVAIGIGNDFGDGMRIGIQEGMGNAVRMAQRMSGQIVTAASLPNMNFIQNMPDIAGEITVANEQAATTVNLDGQQIAEIQGYNNSATIAWRNTRAARGVGSR